MTNLEPPVGIEPTTACPKCEAERDVITLSLGGYGPPCQHRESAPGESRTETVPEPSFHRRRDWDVIECGRCVSGLIDGGWLEVVPTECPHCNGGVVSVHRPTGTLARYPGGPLVGRLPASPGQPAVPRDASPARLSGDAQGGA